MLAFQKILRTYYMNGPLKDLYHHTKYILTWDKCTVTYFCLFVPISSWTFPENFTAILFFLLRLFYVLQTVKKILRVDSRYNQCWKNSAKWLFFHVQFFTIQLLMKTRDAFPPAKIRKEDSPKVFNK